MGVIFTFLVSWILGFLVLVWIRPVDKSIRVLDLFLTVGLGFGITSQIIFYIFMFFGQVHQLAFIIGPILVIFILWSLLRKKLRLITIKLEDSFVLCLILGAVLFLALAYANARPFGDWDGWAYWNYQAKFFNRAGLNWSQFIEYGMQAHHPWLLPLWTLWGWSVVGTEESIVPLLIAVMFTVSCVGLLIASLKERIGLPWSLLGGLFLCSIPIYLGHGTSQYADIIAAYFILASVVLSLQLFEKPNIEQAILTGLFLGLTAGIKDNGITAALFLMAINLILLRRHQLSYLIRPFVLSVIAVILAIILMKCFSVISLNNKSYDISWMNFFNIERWLLVVKFLSKQFLNVIWGGSWFLFAMVVILRFRTSQYVLKMMIVFVCFYIFSYVALFVLSVLELNWLLDASFNRMLFLMLPTVIFLMVHMINIGEKK